MIIFEGCGHLFPNDFKIQIKEKLSLALGKLYKIIPEGLTKRNQQQNHYRCQNKYKRHPNFVFTVYLNCQISCIGKEEMETEAAQGCNIANVGKQCIYNGKREQCNRHCCIQEENQGPGNGVNDKLCSMLDTLTFFAYQGVQIVNG